jgi:metallophosphoesterase (TIGR00282 family)
MPSNGRVTILFIGDVMGEVGRDAVALHLPRLREAHDVDFVVANGENAAGGFGITGKLAEDLFHLGVDVITTGNHLWDRMEVVPYLRDATALLRPANFPAGVVGRGFGVFAARGGVRVGVVNLMGRLFMKPLDCPFRAGERIVESLRRDTPIVLVDFHAEATSEKQALASFLDGQVTAVVGTHTHVQTADEGILPNGTAAITDVGMTGPHDSIIGVEKGPAIQRFLDALPNRFSVAKGDVRLSAVVVTADAATGRALAIERLSVRDGAAQEAQWARPRP